MTRRTPSPNEPASTTFGWLPSRIAREPRWPAATTPSSPRSWSRSRPPTRCATTGQPRPRPLPGRSAGRRARRPRPGAAAARRGARAEPGELRDLQAAILRQDAALAWAPTNGTTPATSHAPDARGDASAAPASTAAVPTQRTGGREVAGPAAPWPTVGRETPSARSRRRSTRPWTGQPAFAALVGDLGSTSAGWRTADPRRAGRGVRVAVGRCSQDEGALPLWPWAGGLRGAQDTLPQDASAPARGSPLPDLGPDLAAVLSCGPGTAAAGRPRRPALGRPFHPAGAAAARRVRDDRRSSRSSAPGARARTHRRPRRRAEALGSAACRARRPAPA